MVDHAVSRLEHGDLTEVDDAIRLRLRKDLGDDRWRSGAHWYWVRFDADGRPTRCYCHARRRTKRCSHTLAARLFCKWLDERDEERERARSATPLA